MDAFFRILAGERVAARSSLEVTLARLDDLGESIARGEPRIVERLASDLARALVLLHEAESAPLVLSYEASLEPSIVQLAARGIGTEDGALAHVHAAELRALFSLASPRIARQCEGEVEAMLEAVARTPFGSAPAVLHRLRTLGAALDVEDALLFSVAMFGACPAVAADVDVMHAVARASARSEHEPSESDIVELFPFFVDERRGVRWNDLLWNVRSRWRAAAAMSSYHLIRAVRGAIGVVSQERGADSAQVGAVASGRVASSSDGALARARRSIPRRW